MVSPYQLLGNGQVLCTEPNGVGKFHPWFHPELGFSLRMRHMHVHPSLFTGKEEQSVGALAKYRRGHASI